MQTLHDTHQIRTDGQPGFIDPLDADVAGDATLLVTRRGLARVALAATETATRLAAQQSGVEPMAWMMTPRRMFNGGTALEACLDRQACVRTIVLHAAGTSLDADPEAIDALIDDVDEIEDPLVQGQQREEIVASPCVRAGRGLFTAYVVAEQSSGIVQAFAAAVATDAETFRGALFARYGEGALDAEVRQGFDPSLPLSEALVTPALADMLLQIAADPTSPLADGLDVRIEQRFAA